MPNPKCSSTSGNPNRPPGPESRALRDRRSCIRSDAMASAGAVAMELMPRLQRDIADLRQKRSRRASAMHLGPLTKGRAQRASRGGKQRSPRGSPKQSGQGNRRALPQIRGYTREQVPDDSQAYSAGSIPAIRSTTKPQVSNLGLACCLDLSSPPRAPPQRRNVLRDAIHVTCAIHVAGGGNSQRQSDS